MGVGSFLERVAVALERGVAVMEQGGKDLTALVNVAHDIDKKLAHFRTIARRWEDAQPGPRPTTPDELAAWGFGDTTLLDRKNTGPAVPPKQEPEQDAPTPTMPVGLPKWEDL